MKLTNNNVSIILIFLFSLFGTIGISFYVENYYLNGNTASIFFLFIFVALIYMWREALFSVIEKKKIIIFTIYSLLFSCFAVYGKKLELSIDPSFKYTMIIGIVFAVLPFVYSVDNWIKNINVFENDNGKLKYYLFFVVVIFWLIIYLSAYPGIYTTDSMYWYYEFANPKVAISSHWSPFYAGLFYCFVHSGKMLFNSYEIGLGVFTFIQMSFILYVIYKMYFLIEEYAKGIGIILFTLFLFVPSLCVLSISTAQDAPFTGCFAMIVYHLIKMVSSPNKYFSNKFNILAFIFWGLMSIVIRNNAYYIFIVFIPFIYFYHKKYRSKLLVSVLVLIIVASIYKGPVLDLMGVQKGTAIREMISMPLQQLAYVYNYDNDNLNLDEKKLLEEYIGESDLIIYKVRSGISDHLKGAFNLDKFKKNPSEFIKLYLNVGLKSTKSYVKAAYLQNLGLMFIDKDYPDERIYHPYLNYSSYDFTYDNIRMLNDEYIEIKRFSYFNELDEILKQLFESSGNDDGSDDEQLFSSIPLLSVFGRSSTYFWILIYLCFYSIYKKQKQLIIIYSFLVLFTLTIVLAPLIMYRYYAPLILTVPMFWPFVLRNKT